MDGEEKPGKMDSSSDTPGNEPFFFSFLFFFCGNCVETFTSTLSRSDLRLGDGVGFRVIRIDLKFFKRLYLKF